MIGLSIIMLIIIYALTGNLNNLFKGLKNQF